MMSSCLILVAVWHSSVWDAFSTVFIFAILLLYLYFPPCKRHNQPRDDVCLTAIFLGQLVDWYQNVSILDFIGNKDNSHGGNNWGYK